MPEQKKLKMTFDPNTIEHLGVRMYSTLPPVLAELIANAHDAYAENVTLKLKDKNDNKEIIIEDDGEGMSFDEINKKFLKIGRNRRKEDQEMPPKGKRERKMIGKKGLGKLSFFGIAHEVEIVTKKNGKKTTFVMSWEKIKETTSSSYNPEIKKTTTCSSQDKGTKITLRNIKRKTDFNADQLAVSLSRMFIFSNDFKITIQHNEKKPVKISNKLRYKDLNKECEWHIPLSDDYNFDKNDYLKTNQIKGHLIVTKKPIKPKTEMRGVSLFSRTKLVNKAEYFSNSHSSHFFSYLTGYLQVDFIDDLREDVISTNRQSLNWDHEEMQELKDCLRELIDFLERDWRKKRTQKLKKKSRVDTEVWFSKLPEEHNIKKSVKLVVTNIKKSGMTEKQERETVERVHNLVPEYPIYHWRHLHDKVQDASREKYENEDYYGAFQETVKRYTSTVREKSSITDLPDTDKNLMGKVFGKEGILKVAQNFKKRDGSSFNSSTTDSIEEGQKFLSMGVIAGGRNPTAHEEIVDLKESGLFTEKDCLDALSLLSHLFRRLDKAQKK